MAQSSPGRCGNRGTSSRECFLGKHPKQGRAVPQDRTASWGYHTAHLVLGTPAHYLPSSSSQTGRKLLYLLHLAAHNSQICSSVTPYYIFFAITCSALDVARVWLGECLSNMSLDVIKKRFFYQLAAPISLRQGWRPRRGFASGFYGIAVKTCFLCHPRSFLQERARRSHDATWRVAGSISRHGCFGQVARGGGHTASQCSPQPDPVPPTKGRGNSPFPGPRCQSTLLFVSCADAVGRRILVES